MPRLEDLDLTLSITPDQYESELDVLQEELSSLAVELHRQKRIAAIVFEGMDAAGKGGAIRRLISGLDPQLYRVLPYAAPTPEERARHYLWRFQERLPEPGSMAIFDRSWYGRVLVERVEGFATEEEWRRSYREINEMERSWTESGILVIKFWLQITLEEQLKRFQAREESPLKNWKITQEDWRNREKWPQYRQAIEDMLSETSTPDAPWNLIEANNKHYARLKVLKTVTEAFRQL